MRVDEVRRNFISVLSIMQVDRYELDRMLHNIDI